MKYRYLLALWACILACSSLVMAQQQPVPHDDDTFVSKIVQHQKPELPRAGILSRFYLVAGGGMENLSQSHIASQDDRPFTNFTGLTHFEGFGILLSKGFSIEAQNSEGIARGKVKLPTAASDFKTSIANDPELAAIPGLVDSLQIPIPSADLRLTERNWSLVFDKRLHLPRWLGHLPIMGGGGPTRVCVDSLTAAKDGVPNGIAVNAQGQFSVTTSSLFNKETDCRHSGNANIGVPIEIHPGIELTSGYWYLSGNRIVGVAFVVHPFGIGKRVSY